MTNFDAQKIIAKRTEMLASIARSISPALYGALEKKIAYERSALFEFIESDAKIAETVKALNRTLPAEYFVQKQLEITII